MCSKISYFHFERYPAVCARGLALVDRALCSSGRSDRGFITPNCLRSDMRIVDTRRGFNEQPKTSPSRFNVASNLNNQFTRGLSNPSVSAYEKKFDETYYSLKETSDQMFRYSKRLFDAFNVSEKLVIVVSARLQVKRLIQQKSNVTLGTQCRCSYLGGGNRIASPLSAVSSSISINPNIHCLLFAPMCPLFHVLHRCSFPMYVPKYSKIGV